jgi:acyl dehydratase
MAGAASEPSVTPVDATPVDATAPRVVQRGLWFEELEVGTVYEHRPGRTVSEADNILFSTLTMNHQALHLDAAFAAEQPFGQRLMNSMFTLSVLVGLSANHLTQGTLVANLGFAEVTFPKPLFHGDTLYGETTVTAKRPSSSRPGEGVVTFEHVGRNQYGVVVARATRVMLVRLRPVTDGDNDVASDGADGGRGEDSGGA